MTDQHTHEACRHGGPKFVPAIRCGRPRAGISGLVAGLIVGPLVLGFASVGIIIVVMLFGLEASGQTELTLPSRFRTVLTVVVLGTAATCATVIALLNKRGEA